MSADWWQAIAAGASIIVTIVVAFVAGASGHVKRRGEQAELAFRLAEQLRGERDRHNAERILSPAEMEALGAQIERMDRTARFMASEYSRRLMRDGVTFFTIVVLIVYGFILLLISGEASKNMRADPERFDDPALPWLILIFFAAGLVSLTIGASALVHRILRRRRIRAAGLPVQGFWAEFTGVGPIRLHDIHNLFEKRARHRALRAEQKAAARQGQNVGGTGEGEHHEH